MVLIASLSDVLTIPIIAAGEIGNARAIALALTLGHARYAPGLRYSAATKAGTWSAWRSVLPQPAPEDVAITRAFSDTRNMGKSTSERASVYRNPLTRSYLMRQLFLALVLIATPVGVFAGVYHFIAPRPAAAAGLGDLTSLKQIISDVQVMAARGDMNAAAKRITDYEAAWDQGQTSIRPLNPIYWDHIDHASDTAIKSLRVPAPSQNTVEPALAHLMAVLNDPSRP